MSSIDNEYRQIRLQKAETLREHGINPYPYHFDRSHKAEELHLQYKDLEADTRTEDHVKIAGRIRTIRNSGMFIVLQDETAQLQVFCHEEDMPADQLERLKLLDIGDWIGVHGYIRRTKRGELTVNTQNLIILTKSLLPLPEKFHGLTDIETRYRQRYVDLIVNDESRDRLRKRSLIITGIREYMTKHGFLEVETPMLHPIPGGAAAKPFVTHHNALNLEMYLRIAPELYLKRLIVGGLSDKVFEINRCFRNEGLSPRHNPEFTSIEMYQAYADYHDMMDLTEDLVQHVALKIHGTDTVMYNGTEISFKKPWVRKTMTQLVHEAIGVDFLTIHGVEEARQVAKEAGVHVAKTAGWGKILETIFAEKVEHTLMQPTHVIDFPVEISPLAKVHRHDPRLTERFESYANCWEIANAFSELTDPIDQRERFEAQVSERDAGDDEAHLMDQDFLTALEYGMPPCGGLGIGIDRLIMLLTDAQSIRDVIAFPTMKPKDE